VTPFIYPATQRIQTVRASLGNRLYVDSQDEPVAALEEV
jgi:hypothetical protein